MHCIFIFIEEINQLDRMMRVSGKMKRLRFVCGDSLNLTKKLDENSPLEFSQHSKFECSIEKDYFTYCSCVFF